MNKILILVFAFTILALCSDIHSQWERQTEGLPETWGIGAAIDACDNSNAIISVAKAGTTCYKTSDCGLNWSPVPYNLSGFNIAADIEMISLTHYIAVLENRIVITTNGGSSWSIKFNGLNLTTMFNYVEMFDENIGIAMGDPVGNNPTLILKTIDGGNNWTQLDPQQLNGCCSGDAWRRIDFINEEIAYFFPSITSANNFELFKSLDGGQTWTGNTILNTARVLKFYNENIGFNYDYGQINYTIDGGVTWTSQITQMTGCGMDFEFLPGNSNFVWFTDGVGLYFTEDAGENWITDETTGLPDTEQYSDIIFIDAEHGWLLCNHGYLFHYGDIETSIDDAKDNEVPNEITLYQNYPNPFNPSTTISFVLSSASFTSLKIYNSVGEEIETLVADKLQSGIYFYKLESGKYSETKKLVLIK